MDVTLSISAKPRSLRWTTLIQIAIAATKLYIQKHGFLMHMLKLATQKIESLSMMLQ